jgi:hypothetical protein
MTGAVRIDLEHFPMVIAGQAVEAASGRIHETENPYTGAPWPSVPALKVLADSVDRCGSSTRAGRVTRSSSGGRHSDLETDPTRRLLSR